MNIKDKYNKEIVKSLNEKLTISNVMKTPKIEKIVLNMGIGTYVRTGGKDYSSLKTDLALITGQQPIVKHAKKAVSNFKLRAGMPVGLMVTLRGDTMHNFLYKLINVVLPRIKDFRGINKKSFDKNGNFNFGIKEHTIFPEVPQLDVVRSHGIQITIKTNTDNNEESKLLLEEMGFPFSK